MNVASLLIAVFLSQQSATIEISVDAGTRDRRDTVVTVPVTLPAPSAGATTAILEDGSGRTLQAQIASGRELRFVLPELKAGKSATFKVTFIRDPGKLDEIFAWKDGEMRAKTGEGTYVARDPFPAVHVAHATWKELTRPKPVERLEVTP